MHTSYIFEAANEEEGEQIPTKPKSAPPPFSNHPLSSLPFHFFSQDLMVALAAGRYEVVATSYDLLRACVDRLKTHRFDAVLFDEYHTIKSSSARVSQAACELKTKRVFGLTGTLIQVGVLKGGRAGGLRGCFESPVEAKR